MAGSPHFNKYPMRPLRFISIFCALGGIVAFTWWHNHAIAAFGAVVYSILLILSLRTGTITNQDEITVRGFLGTKKISWPDIQDIRVEENPVGRVETDYTKAAPKQLVVVYDRHGKRTVLPNINTETLGRKMPFAVEVSHIRSTWEQLRGEDWVPMPGIHKIADEGQ